MGLRQDLDNLMNEMLSRFRQRLINAKENDYAPIDPLKIISVIPNTFKLDPDALRPIKCSLEITDQLPDSILRFSRDQLFPPESEDYQNIEKTIRTLIPNESSHQILKNWLDTLVFEVENWFAGFLPNAILNVQNIFPEFTRVHEDERFRSKLKEQLKKALTNFMLSKNHSMTFLFEHIIPELNIDESISQHEQIDDIINQNQEMLLQLNANWALQWSNLEQKLINLAHDFERSLSDHKLKQWSLKVWLQGVKLPADSISLSIPNLNLNAYLRSPREYDFGNIINRDNLCNQLQFEELPVPPFLEKYEVDDSHSHIRIIPLRTELEKKYASDYQNLDNVRFATSAILEVDITTDDDHDPLFVIEDIFFNCLRLFKSGNVDWQRTNIRDNSILCQQEKRLAFACINQQTVLNRFKLEITQNESQDLSDFINFYGPKLELFIGQQDHLLSIALQRYNHALKLPAYSLDAHRISVAVSCLEMLLLEDNPGNDGITDKFSSRCFKLFDKLQVSLESIGYSKSNLPVGHMPWKNLYQIRCNFVHGNCKIDDPNPEKLVSLALNTARLALLVFISKDVSNQDEKHKVIVELEESSPKDFKRNIYLSQGAI